MIADEHTDVATIEEFSITFCYCVENESPVEHFIEILSLKKLMLAQYEECTESQACTTNSRCLE